MQIGILGAAFNPPHIGHLLMAGQALEFAPFDSIWFMPTYRHTFAKHTVDPIHRLAMCKLLIQNHPKFMFSEIEINNKLDGNTINLVPILKKQYPKDQFTFIIGSDNLSSFHKWGDWKELLKQMPFLVIPRAGYELKPMYDGMKPLVHKLLTVTNISSTIIRERKHTGLPINLFVTESISDYIDKHGLYQK